MMLNLRTLVPVALLLVPTLAPANEVCQGEFQPLVEAHQATMNKLNSAMPKGKPTTYEQALSRAQNACQLLGSGVASFQKLDAWVSTNKDFCQIPDKVATDIKTGMSNLRRSQSQACGAVGQLKANRAKAEAQMQQGGAVGGGGIVGGQRRDDPFNVNVGRKPQLQSL